MGRIIASVQIENITDPAKSLRCDALVDTDASHLVLPDLASGLAAVAGSAAVALADSCLPARRAAALDPMAALREE